ncbi:MAG: hypothetical protein GDA56_13725 [Hormoscilla sp. GM7CHS1pb]|nr:hypothetical protein [Hormoscilla sp. GM7CHS1pb]
MKSMFKAFGTVVCLVCLLVFCGVGSAFADEGVEPADTRARLADNQVELSILDLDIDISTKPTNVRFIEKRHDITNGQPYGGTTAKYDGSKMLINVRAGRQKSEETAKSFAEAVAGGGVLVCTEGANLPSELNFWVQGDFEVEQEGVTYTCKDFIIAQGNTGLTNNWWLAGPKFLNATTQPLIGPLLGVCTDSSGILPKISVLAIIPRLDNGLNCVNTFQQTLVRIPFPQS